jgi:hypothetical protein
VTGGATKETSSKVKPIYGMFKDRDGERGILK